MDTDSRPSSSIILLYPSFRTHRNAQRVVVRKSTCPRVGCEQFLCIQRPVTRYQIKFLKQQGEWPSQQLPAPVRWEWPTPPGRWLTSTQPLEHLLIGQFNDVCNNCTKFMYVIVMLTSLVLQQWNVEWYFCDFGIDPLPCSYSNLHSQMCQCLQIISGCICISKSHAR